MRMDLVCKCGWVTDIYRLNKTGINTDRVPVDVGGSLSGTVALTSDAVAGTEVARTAVGGGVVALASDAHGHGVQMWIGVELD